MSRDVLNKTEIKKKFSELLDGKKHTPQKRGFECEKLVYSVLHNEDLEPKSGYKPEGEQIDGALFWSGQPFLLEANGYSEDVGDALKFGKKHKNLTINTGHLADSVKFEMYTINKIHSGLTGWSSEIPHYSYMSRWQQ